MAFDDVSIPAVTFVCVAMAMALVGNSLVLLVFGCRWRSTNDTKIYIMVLAALDLLCALVSMPRDLISLLPETDCLVKNFHMQVYCKISVFFTYQLNVASALILLAIAVSRFIKVTKVAQGESGGLKPRAQSGRSLVKAVLKRAAIAVSTVRGARTVSGLAFALACLQGSPVLMIYGSGQEVESPPANISEMVTSTGFDGSWSEKEAASPPYDNRSEDNAWEIVTESLMGKSGGDFPTCHTSCMDDIHEDYAVTNEVFNIFQCVFFVVMAVTLISIYGAILLQLCCSKDRHHDSHCSDSTRRNSAFFFPDPSPPKMLQQQRHLSNPGANGSLSEEQAVKGVANRTDSDSTEPSSPRSVSGLRANNFKASPAMRRARIKSDSVQFVKNDSQELTFFPPLSYSSQQCSQISLSRQTSQTNDLTIPTTPIPNNRLSTASFQLSKTGNRARQTTLVFLMVTLIYIVSYLPYFILTLSMYFTSPAGAGGAGLWEESGLATQAVMKIGMRSYLIANAANPLVYGLCNPYFREQLGKLLTCRRQII